jgi:hypothetical protein
MLFTSKDFSFLFDQSSHRRPPASISGKLFRSDIVLINIGGQQALSSSPRPGRHIGHRVECGGAAGSTWREGDLRVGNRQLMLSSAFHERNR